MSSTPENSNETISTPEETKSTTNVSPSIDILGSLRSISANLKEMSHKAIVAIDGFDEVFGTALAKSKEFHPTNLVNNLEKTVNKCVYSELYSMSSNFNETNVYWASMLRNHYVPFITAAVVLTSFPLMKLSKRAALKTGLFSGLVVYAGVKLINFKYDYPQPFEIKKFTPF